MAWILRKNLRFEAVKLTSGPQPESELRPNGPRFAFCSLWEDFSAKIPKLFPKRIPAAACRARVA